MLGALLGLESRSILDNPNISLNDPRTWNEIFGESTASASGVSVSPRKALTYAPAWQAVNLISGDIAAMPFDLYRRRPDISAEAREKAVDHPAYNLVRMSPYPNWHQVKFWRRLMVHALLWNNAYAVIEKTQGGEPISMLPLLPDRTKPVEQDGLSFYMSEINGRLFPFAPSQILHLEGITIEGTADCETVHKLRNAIGLGLAAEKFASTFFRRGGRTGGILEIPVEMRKQAADNLETGFRRTYEDGPDAAFMTFVARDNVKFHKAQFNAEEAQMQGTREEQALEASRIWNVPPHKLGIANAVSYNSLEQENKSYHSTALVHWESTISAESRIKLLTSEEQDAYYFEHNTDSLLSSDALTRTQVAQMEIQMGTLSRDEYRAKVNRNPREDGGGGFVESVQFSGGTDTEEQPDEEEQPEEDVSRQLLEESIARATRLASSIVRRKAKAKKSQQFCEWFDSSFHTVSDSFIDEISLAARSFAIHNNWPPQEYAESISGSIVGAMRQDIDNCLNCCSDATIVDGIAEVLRLHTEKDHSELIAWKSETISQ